MKIINFICIALFLKLLSAILGGNDIKANANKKKIIKTNVFMQN